MNKNCWGRDNKGVSIQLNKLGIVTQVLLDHTLQDFEYSLHVIKRKMYHIRWDETANVKEIEDNASDWEDS